MQYTILIAAAFLLATIAVATLSPFDSLPQRAPQREATITPPVPEPPNAPALDDESAAEESSDGDEENSDAEQAAAQAADDEPSDDESDGEEDKKTESAAAEPESSSGGGSYETSSEGPDEEPVGEYFGEENPDASD
jgi:hypothetical protein